MTWIIKVTHTDEKGDQVACQAELSDDMVNFSVLDLPAEFFQTIMRQIEYKLKIMRQIESRLKEKNDN